MSRPAQLETITTQLKSAKGVAEKFKAQGATGLDGNTRHYKKLDLEMLDKIGKIKKKYGID